MGRKSNFLRETYLRVVALIKTLRLLHAAELTEAAREMATNPGPSVKPPGIETLRDFDLNDDYDPERPEHCDLAQPDNCGTEEKDHTVREDAVPDSARSTPGGGQDWRDEALDEVRSVLLKYMQPDDAGDLEQNNVLIERTNTSTVGFRLGIAVRKVCEQFTLEKTNRMTLLDSVTQQKEEIEKVKAQNETLRMRLAESVSRQDEETKRVAAENEELRMRLSESICRHEEGTKKAKAQNEELRMRFSESARKQEEEIKNLSAQNEELRMKFSESARKQDEEIKNLSAQNEELRMEFSESARKQEEEIKNLSVQNEELRMEFAESARKQEESKNLSAQNEEMRMRLSESVTRQEDVIKNLTAQKEELQCKLIDNFLALRPQRPMCDSMCSNAFRISAINEPGNSALSTHQYRAGFLDQTPLVVGKKDQPAEKHPEDVEAVELANNDCPQFPPSLKRRRTLRTRMQTVAKSDSEEFAMKHLTGEGEHMQEARQSLLTDKSPMPTADPCEDDHVIHGDHAAPHEVDQQCPKTSDEGCDSTTLRLKRIFGEEGKKPAPPHRHASPWHEDIQSAEAMCTQDRPRVYQEYVCGIGAMSCKVTLGILKIYESGIFRVYCRCEKLTCIAGATWNPWDYVGSHACGKPADKWWDYIWVQDGGGRPLISNHRNMDMYAADNKKCMQQDELKSACRVRLQMKKRTWEMMNSS